MNHQVFMDMDGVLVDFETGVLKYMNEEMKRLKDSPDDPLHKLARSTAKEIGGWDVEIDRWHIARPDSSEQSFPRNYRTRDFMYRLVEDDVELWANLGWEKGGKKLWDYAKNIPGIEILSAPMAEGSREGKRLWVERELGLPRNLVNLSDTKEPFGTHKGKQGLLIDDRDKYINEFIAGGGIAIKHNPDDVDNTIRQLKELGY
tara:strand:- start:348 stop:956 length:609 start_codon:yes stop_codon:yes gene_type:complete